jgi:peptidyl-dipeptidase A
MKLAASVSLAALALAACATTQPAPAPVAFAEGAPPAALPADGLPHPLTVEGARAFIADVEKDLYDLSVIGGRAAWINATYINDDSDAVAAYFGTIGTEKGVKYPTQGPNMRPSRVWISTRRVSSTSCAARWCLRRLRRPEPRPN